ncbi:DUF302 domain-containing protein [Cytobacillus sp. Hm23]|uniref:DUF302 domain-containing protein n=1 Tax=Cytobacillus sp. IB215316 TaxID=3097354 RepID=UPI002A18464C|nr:DUF302 domain-containing protein [Cytobacillus sp. IB215316]MDX8362444.1 DUF302 domain-containing protein [Cytobacillus sp. IB215316]
MFHFTVNTEKPVSQILKDLEENLSKEQFSILWSFNIKDKLNAKGLEYNQDFYVLEVCNPFDAKEVLSITNQVGYFLPCKIVVYGEQETNKIGMVKPTTLMSILDDANLDSKANEIEQRLVKCIDRSK